MNPDVHGHLKRRAFKAFMVSWHFISQIRFHPLKINVRLWNTKLWEHWGLWWLFVCLEAEREWEGSQTQHPPPKLAWSRRVLVTVWFEVGGLNKVKVATWGDLGISSRALASGEPTQRLASSNIIFAWKYTAFKMPSQVLSFDARLSLSGG